LGLRICANIVWRLLHEVDYALHANRKSLCGQTSPLRDQQFGVLNYLRQEFTLSSYPIISVDTKKKELQNLSPLRLRVARINWPRWARATGEPKAHRRCEGERDGQHYFSMDFIEGRTLADLGRNQFHRARQALPVKTIS